MAANPQTKPTDFGCQSAWRLLLSTFIIAISYYYSAKIWHLFYHPTETRKLSRSRHHISVCSLCPQDCISQ